MGFLFIALLHLSASVDIDCKFGGYDWNEWGQRYICDALVEDIRSPDEFTTSVSGAHKGSNTNADVLGVKFIGLIIYYLPQGLEKFFPNMKELYVFRSDLKKISRSDFAGYKKLTTLSLSRNHLSIVPSDAFDDLSELEYLSLSFNQLTDVPYLRSLPKLKELYLFENSIETVTPDDFEGNPLLEILWFQDNKIRHIIPESFSALPQLKFADFRANRCINKSFTKNSLQKVMQEISTSCSSNDILSLIDLRIGK